jgi:Uma2 family endonuclease
MTAATKTRMNVDQYLAWAQEHPGRYELSDGEVVAMSPKGVERALLC